MTSNKPKNYYKIPISSLRKKKPSATATNKPKTIAATAGTDTKKTQAIRQTPKPTLDYDKTQQLIRDTPHLHALQMKVYRAASPAEMEKAQAKLSNAVDDVFTAALEARMELDKPKEENVTLKDDRHTYYDIRGEYTLMYWDNKAWLRANTASHWSWIVGKKSGTYAPEHLTVQDFSKILKSKPSFLQLNSEFQIYQPTWADFPSSKDSESYSMMNLNSLLNEDEKKAKKAFIK